jgi:DNA polymerase III epsilon subunit-like protein
MGDIRLIVAFNAPFDRAAILTMCAQSGLRLPRMSFVCAAKTAESRLGQRLDLRASVEALGLPFPGRPHDPLADARAAAAVVLACQAAAWGPS